MAYKRNYKRRAPVRRYAVNRTKKMVTGHGPTMLETMARGAGSLAKLAGAVMPIVAAINTEEKFLDVPAGGTATASVPIINCLNSCSQGITESTRIGNSILARNLNIRFSLNQVWATADSAIAPRIRITLFSDKSQGGTPPTIAQVYQSSSSNISAFNKNYSDRFVIIKDKVICPPVNYGGGIPVTGGAYQMVFKFFKKLDFHIRFLGTDNQAASNGQNSIYLIVWTNSDDASAITTLTYYSRLNFTDN